MNASIEFTDIRVLTEIGTNFCIREPVAYKPREHGYCRVDEFDTPYRPGQALYVVYQVRAYPSRLDAARPYTRGSAVEVMGVFTDEQVAAEFRDAVPESEQHFSQFSFRGNHYVVPAGTSLVEAVLMREVLPHEA